MKHNLTPVLTVKPKLVLLLFCCLFVNLQVHSEVRDTATCKIIFLPSDLDHISINTSLCYLEDRENIYTLEEIQNTQLKDHFIQSSSTKLNFGFTSSVYWVAFSIKNQRPEINDWLMVIDYVHLDSVEFFAVDSNHLVSRKVFGDMYPFEQRELEFRPFILPLQVADTAVHSYFLRIKTEGSMQFPITIWREKAYFKKYILNEIYYGIFFGIMLALIVINLCVYLYLKDISYLYCAILILGTTFFQALMSGHVFQYFLQNAMWLNNNLIPTSIAFSEFCIILFARTFLNIKRYSMRLNQLMNWFIFMAIFLMVVVFFTPYRIGGIIASTTSLLYILLGVLGGIVCLIRGNRAARIYILAFTLFFMGSVAMSLTSLGLLPRNMLTAHGMEIGSMLNWIFLTLALTDNYKLNLAEKERANQELNLIRKRAYEELELNVKERTIEIQHKNEALILQKEKLQTTLDFLRKTQEQLVESEKMAALGGLVAGVAHEINTPVGIGVTAITNLLEEVDRMAELYEKDRISRKDFKEFLASAKESGELIRKNLERTAALVQSFKLVSADQVSEQQRAFYFKEYLEDIVRSLYPRYKRKNINIVIDCEPDLELNSYPGAYAQVFTNLLLNSLSHGFVERDNGNISIRVKRQPDKLRIEYRDDGAGISREDLPHIFEPFYTRDKSKGTGLGLNIVYNIVKQKLMGTIECESQPGKGVLFMILLNI